MSKKYVANKFEIIGGTSSDVLLADGTLGSAPSGLELITDEGANTSYRLTNVPASDRDAFSGAVGYNVDVSLNDDRTVNTFTYGAEGNFGFVSGGNNYISGDYNTALGGGNQILGDSATSLSAGSTVMGFTNIINNYSYVSITSGFRNTVGVPANNGATGLVYFSSVLGAYNSMPQGRGSSMIGMGLLGSSSYTTIVGAGNVDLTTVPATDASSSFLNSSNPAFIVGVGTVDTTVGGGGVNNPTITRGNGFVVMRSGDVDFPKLTGTLIDAASATSAVTKGWVESKVPSDPILSVKVSLTAAQLKSLDTTEIEAIPNPGVGKFIKIHSAIWSFVWGTTPFDAVTLRLSQTCDNYATCPFDLNRTSDMLREGTYLPNTNLCPNSNVTVSGNFDSVLTGDSTVDVYISYQIITL